MIGEYIKVSRETRETRHLDNSQKKYVEYIVMIKDKIRQYTQQGGNEDRYLCVTKEGKVKIIDACEILCFVKDFNG